VVEEAQTQEDQQDDDGEGVAENLMNPNKKISKNDFVFCKVVGRGSFGKVYLVKKKDRMELPLALKVLSKDVVQKRNLLIKTQGKIHVLMRL
jgi:serine/threonine protein kinase